MNNIFKNLNWTLLFLAMVSCSNDPKSTPGAGEGPTEPTEPVGIFESRSFIQLQESFQVDMNIGHPDLPSYAERLEVFFGETLNGTPISIEAQATGFKWIHKNTSGNLRFETLVNLGSFWAELISIPGTSVLNATDVDMILTEDPALWFPEFHTSYSLVRVVGTVNADSSVSGRICVRTVAATDWQNNNLWIPSNAIGTLFTNLHIEPSVGQFDTLSSSQIADLRTRLNCSESDVWTTGSTKPSTSSIPAVVVLRYMGKFVINNVDDILE